MSGNDSSWANLAPPNIEALAPYQPGKPVEELERELGITGAIKLASNENPLGPSPRGLAAAREALLDVHRYPDAGGYRLRAALSERLGAPTDELVLGGGSNEIIDLLARTFCRPGQDEVLTHRYAFFMYKVSCQAAGVTLREAEVSSDLACDVDALAAAVNEKTKLIFLPNPNNPTGLYIPTSQFERLLEKIPKRIILVVDEAYHEYAKGTPDYPDGEAYRKAHPRIITLRTFSKAYGLAGLRVGYGIGDKHIVNYLNRVRLPFNVPSPAQEAARAALDDLDHIEKSRRLAAEGIVQITKGLASLPVTVYPSKANFVLVDLRREAGPVYQALLRKGVIVRPLAPSGLLTHVRVSIGTAAENDRAVRAFAEVLG